MQFGKWLSLAMLLVISAPLTAQTPRNYFGVFFNDAQLEASSGEEIDGGNLGGKLGYTINRWLGAEAHAGADFFNDNDDFNHTEVGYVAAFMRLNLPYERINIFGLAGLASVKGDYGSQYDDHFTDGAFGLGVELFGTKRTALSIQFMQYGIDDRYKSFGLGIVHHFDWPAYRPEVN